MSYCQHSDKEIKENSCVGRLDETAAARKLEIKDGVKT